jgi:hypothetical protein
MIITPNDSARAEDIHASNILCQASKMEHCDVWDVIQTIPSKPICTQFRCYFSSAEAYRVLQWVLHSQHNPCGLPPRNIDPGSVLLLS